MEIVVYTDPRKPLGHFIHPSVFCFESAHPVRSILRYLKFVGEREFDLLSRLQGLLEGDLQAGIRRHRVLHDIFSCQILNTQIADAVPFCVGSIGPATACLRGRGRSA